MKGGWLMPIESLDAEICVGCKICFDVCPEDVFRFDEKKKKSVVDYPEDCCACWVCEWFCPVKCIVVSKEPARPIITKY
jgi:NAD-dependent dihydropyrimidine dehydrogenase PreA subunit